MEKTRFFLSLAVPKAKENIIPVNLAIESFGTNFSGNQA
jgi:hypothetical protein